MTKIKTKLLSERYRFSTDYLPYKLNENQKRARDIFLSEVHYKGKYIYVNECPYCNNKMFTKISEIDRRGLPSDILICDNCDGCFKYQIFSPEANKFYYENISYIIRGKKRDLESIEKLFWYRINTYAFKRFHFINRMLRIDPRQFMIVEFGCNDGANLYPWHINGYEILGVDLDKELVEFGKRKGLNLKYGDFLNIRYTPKKTVLIILTHILEHVTNIHKMLEILFLITSPSGYVYIETPSIRYLNYDDALSYFDVEHNYNFELKTLSSLLSRYNFLIHYSDELIRILCSPKSNHKGCIISSRLYLFHQKLLDVLTNYIMFRNTRIIDLLKEIEYRSFRTKTLNILYTLSNKLFF